MTVLNSILFNAKVLANDSHFHPSLIFAGKNRSIPKWNTFLTIYSKRQLLSVVMSAIVKHPRESYCKNFHGRN